MEDRKEDEEIEYVEFKSMEIMPHVLWLKHCH